jgi:acetate kinase
VSKRAAQFLEEDYESMKLIVCHLGNGASLSAVMNGRCVDTTMGLTPLEGLMMGTRSGDIDPSVVEFIAKKENLNVSEVLNILNKKSGLLGLSKNLSSDIRDIEAGIDAGNEFAELAMEVFCYRIAKNVGALVAAMNGVDAIVFTAGIGENDDVVRRRVCANLTYLGTELDLEANNVRGRDAVISTSDSKVKLLAIPTNEELAIARETYALVK